MLKTNPNRHSSNRSAGSQLGRFILASIVLTAVSVIGARQASAYSEIVVFGDSLSDDGNVTHRVNDAFGINYPGGQFNYSDGRFTNSSDTNPGSGTYVGVWHEQLARRFTGLDRASNSLDGGSDYAFGGATTKDGTTDRTVVNNPTPFGGGDYSLTIDNMGKQVDDYIAKGPADGNALIIVWGGGNDLFDDDSAANVTAAANNIGGLVTRLANSGGRTFLVPNVPPLGEIPEYNGDATKSAELNAASSSFRDQLNSVLDSTVAALKANGITITLYRLDVYSLFNKLTTDAGSYGFTNIKDSAQDQSVKVDNYLFWDNIHPTTAGHNQIAQEAAKLIPGIRPAFFNGEANLSGDFSYLVFPNGQAFGYYSYQYYPYIYSTDLGFEYVIDASDADHGLYLYDFTLGTFLYTSPKLYPYLYNFNSSSFYYYFTGTTGPRVLYDFGTSQYIYSN